MNDREVLRPERGHRTARRVLDRRLASAKLLANLLRSHAHERPVAVPVRLNLVPFGYDRPEQLREPLRHHSLDEEGPFYSAISEERQDALDVGDDAFADRRVVVDARLVPVLDVDRQGNRGAAAIVAGAQADIVAGLLDSAILR